MSINILQEQIVPCNKCSRLRNWSITRKSTHKDYLNEDYWEKPVPSLGDQSARLLIVGLAPGAHGANRTGQVFTGDTAGDFLLNRLYRFGFSNSIKSTDRNDGLILKDTYITNVVRCAPPENKPTAEEFNNCRKYLFQELKLLNNLKVILTLGEKSFEHTKRALKELGADVIGIKFKHGEIHQVGEGFPKIISSYHTSKYNIDTGVMTGKKLDLVFSKILDLLK